MKEKKRPRPRPVGISYAAYLAGKRPETRNNEYLHVEYTIPFRANELNIKSSIRGKL